MRPSAFWAAYSWRAAFSTLPIAVLSPVSTQRLFFWISPSKNFCTSSGGILESGLTISRTRPLRTRSATSSSRGSGSTSSQAALRLGLKLNQKHTAWLEQIAGWKQKGPFAYNITQEIAGSDHMKDHLKGHEDQIILQQMVVEALYELTKGEALITTGVGQHQMWAGQWYKYQFPRQFITSGGLGSMGYGYPAALGVKVAHPDKEVIDIDGDGSFLMNIQELATTPVEKIAAKAIILNNQHLGMV